MIYTPEQVKEMVERGFTLLSRAERDRIKLEELNMHDGWYCVLGQVFGWFGTGCDKLFPNGGRFDLESAEKHGFYIEDEHDMFTNYAALQREWIRRLGTEREIAELLSPVGSF